MFEGIDYNKDLSFTGNYSQQDVEALYKAMSAGELKGGDQSGVSGGPLKVESLENTVKILTARPKHTPFFAKIAKKPATNTVEEYNQLTSYGNFDGGFTLEGELPEGSDSIYTRKSQLIKYLGVTGGVTHPMQLVQTGSGVANMMATETQNKVRLMTQLIEGYLPFSDSRIVPEQFKGFMEQHETETGFATQKAYLGSELVIDLRGKVLTDTAIENGSLSIVNRYGIGDTLIGPPRVFSNFVTKYHDKKMIYPIPQHVRDGVFGQRVNEVITQNGGVEIVQSNFFQFSRMKTTSSLATSAKAPAAPLADGSNPLTVVTNDTTTKFGDGAGDYFYAVSAKNRFGESALTALGVLQAVGATECVDLKFTAGTGVPEAATGFCIYRSKVDPTGTVGNTNLYKLFEISTTNLAAGYNGADPGKVRDLNAWLPDTDQAMMVEWDADQVLAWKQLAPMMKMNLAITAPIQRFMVLCYGTAILYAPGKMVRFINAGNSLT